MTATVISCLLEYSDVSKLNKMLTFTNNSTTLDDLQLKTCVPCSSGNPSYCSIPTESLVSGGLSTRSPCQRRHSFSLPDGKVCPSLFTDSLKVEPALLACDRDNRDRDNRFRERSYSETGGQAGASRYKTELCRPFEESGACKYGDKCQFAHGAHELRGLSRHPKYKTELCRTFHSAGFCPYGRRCHFIHNAEERRGPPQQPPGRPRLQHSVSFAGFLSGSRSPPPPPAFSAQDLFAWPRPFQDSSQKLLGPGLGPQPSSQPVAPEPPSPSSAHCWTSPSSAPDSLSDQEGYQSSLSGSESPIQDAARRLPIFSSLSISDD